ncbi:MAG: alanine/ornithine racemase family PLP-dependent enzyme [Tenericutes bacterium]|nr:alanine/ornithine racemase family PLP-dependent enzyme [Mycoplasmatota bacterium]
MFPRIIIDTEKLRKNAKKMITLSKANHIENITFVVKAFAGDKTLVKSLEGIGLTCIGDSRIQNLKGFVDLSFKHKMLIRIPMLTEVVDVISYSDISLNSELSTIKALSAEAVKQNKMHYIMLMFDLGDLREGIYYSSDYLDTIKEILTLPNIILQGIGTNLTCYGGLVPSNKILNRLVDIKNNIESTLNIKINVVSGGNSSSVTLFGTDELPKEINHLRLGESILFGKETSYSKEIPGFYHNVFEFQTEIIELKDKPSYPDGEISINSFGEIPVIEDKGMMKRAIVAIGKQDTILSNLFPIDQDIEIIGGSSDHLILDVTKAKYQVGDIIRFNINYPALVHLMNSDYVKKIYK